MRNDFSGTVTMELQGEEELISRMAPILEQGSWIRITEWKEKVIPVDEDEREIPREEMTWPIATGIHLLN